MPRKRTEPPVLRIEGLSELGKAMARPTAPIPDVFIDDFTGEPLPTAIPEPIPEPQAPIAPDHREIKHGAEQRARDEQLSMLVRLGLVDGPDPIPPEPPRPKPIALAHNQRLIKLGGREFIQTIDMPIPPWRR